MPRKPRVSPIGIPQHIIQRGNNRQACFTSVQDFKAYDGWLKNYLFNLPCRTTHSFTALNHLYLEAVEDAL